MSGRVLNAWPAHHTESSKNTNDGTSAVIPITQMGGKNKQIERDLVTCSGLPLHSGPSGFSIRASWGFLAGSVRRARNSWRWVLEFEPHVVDRHSIALNHWALPTGQACRCIIYTAYIKSLANIRHIFKNIRNNNCQEFFIPHLLAVHSVANIEVGSWYFDFVL